MKRLCKRIKNSANEVSKLCGYIPLALQIAGSFLAVNLDWSPEEYSKRLRTERLKLLKSDDDDPKYDLAATIGLSYAQLTQDEQKYWRILSIFPTSFRRDAAQAMWELDENMGHDLLSKLNRMSLLDYDEKAERYSLHDLLAEYAIAQLKDGEEKEARLKHASYYKNVLSAADHLYLQGGDKVLIGLRLLDLEWENIRTGQIQVSNLNKDEPYANELCMNYPRAYHILALRLHPRQNIHWLESAISSANDLNNKVIVAELSGVLGICYSYLGEIRKAIDYYTQTLTKYTEIKDRKNAGIWLNNLGSAYAALGDARKAIEFHEQALIIDREIGDRRGEGSVLGNLGSEYFTLEDFSKAIDCYKQQLTIVQEIGDKRGEGNADWGIAICMKQKGELEEARKWFQNALRIFKKIESPSAATMQKMLDELAEV